ncbi:DUF3048 domain-containing protein [Peptoniphilus catoniae]|uniref:DUF3048 domain-containing protein n=1 Tax=Peptoniphilus catoniae TaxID=1660341 RepID=UPI0010FD81D3|nr:DUF3048 domain-containing protein [Peptoniphilus catoniae]
MKKPFYLIITAFIFILTACSAQREISELNEGSENKSLPIKKEEPKEYFSPLNGTKTQEDISTEPVFAIMFDNHPKATPQSGLASADLIYEYKVEGEYTRFLGLFQKNKPEVIGPVRSARPYFVNTAAEYKAIYVHWGGSEAGYAQISSDDVKDIDAIIYEGSTFYRNKEVNKKRPHDGYTSYNLLYERAKDLEYINSESLKPKFVFDQSENLEKLMAQSKEKDATSLNLSFFPNYKTSFEYNQDKKSYLALRNDENIIDEDTGEDIYAENIIVVFADSKVTGPNGTLTIYNIGQGEGMFISKGKLMDIKWSKESETSDMVFTTMSGEKLILAPGLTFIETIDSKDLVSVLPEDSEASLEAEKENVSSNNK